MDGPVIETERLILRPPVAGDFEAWAGCMADEATMRFLGGAQPRSAAWRGFCSMAGAWSLYGFAMFSVIERSSGRWIGRLGPWKPVDWPGTEVGWGLAREAWGKGYATEVARPMIEYVFGVSTLDTIYATIAPENTKSQRVADKLGMTFEREWDDDGETVLVYAITRAEALTDS